VYGFRIWKNLNLNPTLYGLVAAIVFALVSIAFAYASLLAGRLLRPAKYESEKMRIYECGEPTIGTAWVRFNIRFYAIALVFLLFDVETVFLFPVATVLKWFAEKGLGWVALAEVFTFVGVLVVGLAYAWRYGNLDWIRTTGGDARTVDAAGRAKG
jgi:NADH-quinone oxidoreductase subunit A